MHKNKPLTKDTKIQYANLKSTKGAIISNGKDTLIILDNSVKNTSEEKIIIKTLKKLGVNHEGN